MAPPLGDEKPSVLMDKMLSILGGHDPCFLFKRLFLQRLPADMRAPLLHSGEVDMRKLAEQADLLWQARSPNLAAGTNAQVSLAEANKISKPRASGNAFKTWRENWQQTQGGPCAYHSYYGAQAKQCTLPCSWKPSGNSNAGRQ